MDIVFHFREDLYLIWKLTNITIALYSCYRVWFIILFSISKKIYLFMSLAFIFFSYINIFLLQIGWIA